MNDRYKQWLEMMPDIKKAEDCNEILRKHWAPAAVITDSWNPKEGKKVPESELLPGELSARTYQVGCYTVRSATRVYKINEPSYCPEREIPADQAELDLIKRDAFVPKYTHDTLTEGVAVASTTTGLPSWQDKLRITHEISAQYTTSSNGDFTYICRAAQSRNYTWSESIKDICAAKEMQTTSDKDASLFVCSSYVGDSFSSDTWYKLDPDGIITTLRLHPYDSEREKARFQ